MGALSAMLVKRFMHCLLCHCMIACSSMCTVWLHVPLCALYDCMFLYVHCMTACSSMCTVWLHVPLCALYDCMFLYVHCMTACSSMCTVWLHVPLCALYDCMFLYVHCMTACSSMAPMWPSCTPNWVSSWPCLFAWITTELAHDFSSVFFLKVCF